MESTPVRGDIGPACSKCGALKIWCGTRWLCRPCQAKTNRDRKSGLTAAQREAERARENELHNQRRASWSPEQRAAANSQTQAWREVNRDRHRRVTREWYQANIEHARSAKMAEYQRNPEAFYARNLTRKARLLAAICTHGPKCVGASFLKALYASTCIYCGDPAEHADHFHPLARGGLHCIENIVPACAACNSHKADRDPHEWLASTAA